MLGDNRSPPPPDLHNRSRFQYPGAFGGASGINPCWPGMGGGGLLGGKFRRPDPRPLSNFRPKCLRQRQPVGPDLDPFLPADKVVLEHDSEISDHLRSGAMQSAEARMVASRARARAWLERGRGGNTAKAWRKPKLNRVDPYKWRHMVNQWLLLHCNLDLEVFQQEKPMSERSDPLTWPRLSLAGDHWCDNECGGQLFQRRLHLTVDRAPEPSHGVHRDVIKSLKFAGVYKFQLCLRVAWHIPEGPWHKQARYQHAAEAFKDRECDDLALVLELGEADPPRHR